MLGFGACTVSRLALLLFAGDKSQENKKNEKERTKREKLGKILFLLIV
jgi:hypothetical protein